MRGEREATEIAAVKAYEEAHEAKCDARVSFFR
jgi:hypothetical protein